LLHSNTNSLRNNTVLLHDNTNPQCNNTALLHDNTNSQRSNTPLLHDNTNSLRSNTALLHGKTALRNRPRPPIFHFQKEPQMDTDKHRWFPLGRSPNGNHLCLSVSICGSFSPNPIIQYQQK